MDYTKIFNEYTTSQGIPFLMLSKRVTFPSDNSLDIYQYLYSDEDIAWTIVSYKIYGSIDYWWVLSALNSHMKFYAKKGSVVKIIKPTHLETVLKYI